MKDTHYHSVILTFQIGLHIDDLHVLKLIQKNLCSGHISISGSRCNYFINDQKSLIHIVLPIFSSLPLNSSKYFQFLIFKKAVNLLTNKVHLTDQGKFLMIQYYYQLKSLNTSLKLTYNPNITINDYWLGGFIDGDGSFSTNKEVPRLKLENHYKEKDLFLKINEYFQFKGNLHISPIRKTKLNSHPTVVLEFNQISFLKNIVVPLFNSKPLLLTNKSKDFIYWVTIINIYYLGYHLYPEGKALINEIKLNINKFRLTTNKHLSSLKLSDTSFTSKLNSLFSLPSPYVVEDGLRYIRETGKPVSEKVKIKVTSNLNVYYFASINECSKVLNIAKKTISKYLSTGENYKNYKFTLCKEKV